LRFRAPAGLEQDLVVDSSGDEPLIADHPQVPAEHALRGFDGVRAYSPDPGPSRPLLEGALAFEPSGDGWEIRGSQRGGTYAYDPPPDAAGIQGAGTVHHIAWASPMDDQEKWREQVLRVGGRPTPVIDRFYFRSVYFREPSGVLFEIATIGPGFTTDEPAETLGQKLALPPAYEHLRAQIEATVTPLPPTR
jgi:glyoxalase family protein